MFEGADQVDPSLPVAERPAAPGYAPGEHLFLVRNPSWTRATDSLRRALADRIELTQIDGYDAELAAIQSDQLDVSFTDDLDPADIARLRGAGQGGPQVHVSPRLVSDWITMNLALPPFDDLHVRRAINFVTNKKTLVDLLWPGSQIQNHAIPDAFENGLLIDYDPFATPDHAGNLDRAKAEMAQSIYDTNGDGVCDDPACSDIAMLVRNDFSEVAVAAQAFASQLAPLGLTLSVETHDQGDVFGIANDPASKNALGFTLGWASDYFNASSWFAPLATSPAIGADWGANLSLLGASGEQLTDWGYPDTSVPSLAQKIDACTAQTGSAQFACWAEADQYLMERVAPWVPLDNRQASRLTSGSVTDFQWDATITMPALDQIAVAPGQ